MEEKRKKKKCDEVPVLKAIPKLDLRKQERGREIFPKEEKEFYHLL